MENTIHMTVYRCLILLTFSIFISISVASCQTRRSNKNDYKTQTLARPIFKESLPNPAGYVNDYENLFTGTEEKQLDSLMTGFEQRTTIQIVVVTIDTTMTTADSLDAFTLQLANFWGVGQKDKNNGMLIGISRGHKKMRIQNGNGIEAVLSDEETKQIVDAVFIPAYKKEQYFEGTFKGVNALMSLLEKRYK